MRRSLFSVLLFLIFVAAPCFSAQMGQIAIYTEAVVWTTVQVANTAAENTGQIWPTVA